MRIRFLAALLALTALLPAAAHAQCPNWLTGPFDNGTAANGANGTVFCSYFWDPDGAGPLPTYYVVGGAFTSIDGVAANHIAMRDPNTGQWQALGAGVNTVPLALTVWNGKLVVGGTGNNNPADTDDNLLTYDGTTWTTLYGGTSTGSVYCLGVLNGELYAGGNFVIYPTVLDIATDLAHWNTAHGLWESVAGPGNNPGPTVNCMTNWNGNLWVGTYNTQGTVHGDVWQFDGVTWTDMVQTNGPVACLQPYNGWLVAGGGFSVVGSSAIRSTMAFNGSVWFQIGSGVGMDQETEALTVFGGQLYAGGYFTHADGNLVNHVAGLIGGSWQPLGLGTVGGGVSSSVLTMLPLGSDLAIGGLFTAADAHTANNMARWSGYHWAPFGGGDLGLLGGVQAMTPYNGLLVAGGTFDQSADPETPAHNVAGWDGNQLYPFGTGMDGQVNALKSYNLGIGINQTHELVAGGNFTHAGGVAASYIAVWDQKNININPVAWAPLGGGLDGPVLAIERATVASVANTYAGGNFTNHIARYNATSKLWESIGAMDGTVYALKAFNGSLFAGGSFTHANGVATGGLARWDGTNWNAVGGFFGGSVYALEAYNGRLVMGGSFPGFGGSPNIASTDGVASYFNLGTGGTTGGTVQALHALGTRLFVGGTFSGAGGVTAQSVAYYDGTWHAMTAGVDNTVYAIGDYHNEAQVGGIFSVAGSVPLTSPGWARWTTSGVPVFQSQSFSQTVNPGATFSFSAVPVSGFSGVTEQWYRNGVALIDGPDIPGSLVSGSTTQTLTITNASPYTVATYTAVLTTSCGSDTSAGMNMSLPGSTGVGTDGPAVDLFESIGPNPSHGPSVVSFSLARDADVKLRVLDISGRRVSQVDYGRLTAGRHQMTWAGRDDEGGAIHSGMYFVTLDVNGQPLGNKRVAIVR